jgi:hypothetical protein
MNVSALQAKVTQAWKAAAAAEATCVTPVLATVTSAQEAIVARAALVEREAQERVLRVEVESTMVLASAREEVEGLVPKIAYLKSELAEVH